MEEAVEYFNKSGFVRFAEPDYQCELTDTFPNDPYFLPPGLGGFGQWGLYDLLNSNPPDPRFREDIWAPQAWDYITSAPDVIVAVLDTGIKETHEDLDQNMWTNPDIYSSFINGINTVALPPTGNITDVYGHGTQVAGIIGAEGNNSVGISGVAWQVKLMACRVSIGALGFSSSDVVEAINFAIINGAKILNMSFKTSDGYDYSLRLAIAAARNYDVIVVTGAANDNRNIDQLINVVYPQCYDLDNKIVTGGIDFNALWGFNKGKNRVHLAAPASILSSTTATDNSSYLGGYYISGTSFAAAHVSGALALLKQRFPFESYFHLINRILANVVIDNFNIGTNCATGGRLNLYNSVTSSAFSAPPFNNNFSRAHILEKFQNESFTLAANNVDATKEAGEPNHANNAGGKSVWWSWTAERNETVYITTAGSGFDTLLAVYDGNAVNNLSPIIANDDFDSRSASAVQLNVTNGFTYRIAVDGWNGACGTVKLTISDNPPYDQHILSFIQGTLQRTAGCFQCQINGPAYRSVRIESSQDLVIWNAMNIIMLDNNGFATYTDYGAGVGHKYYRMLTTDLPAYYTRNIVGYVDLPQIVPGTNYISNPLRALNNNISALFPNMPVNTIISKFNETTQQWENNTYYGNGQWSIPNMTLFPGEGCRIYNPSGSPLSVPIVGEVCSGFFDNAVPNQNALRSSRAPLSGRLRSDLLFPVINGDRVYKKVNGSDVEYRLNNGTWEWNNNGTWLPSDEPTLEVGEAFYSYKNVGLHWYRNMLEWPF